MNKPVVPILRLVINRLQCCWCSWHFTENEASSGEFTVDILEWGRPKQWRGGGNVQGITLQTSQEPWPHVVFEF